MRGVAFDPAAQDFNKWADGHNQYLYVPSRTFEVKIVTGSNVPDDKKGFCHYLGKLWRKNCHPSTDIKKVFDRVYDIGLIRVIEADLTNLERVQRAAYIKNNLLYLKGLAVEHNERRWPLFRFFHLAGFSDRTLREMDRKILQTNLMILPILDSAVNQVGAINQVAAGNGGVPAEL